MDFENGPIVEICKRPQTKMGINSGPMISMQLFEMPNQSRDCLLTLSIGFNYLRSDNNGIESLLGLFSRYNPKSLQDSHQLVWPSLTQPTLFDQNFFALIVHIKQWVLTLNQLNLVWCLLGGILPSSASTQLNSNSG